MAKKDFNLEQSIELGLAMLSEILGGVAHENRGRRNKDCDKPGCNTKDRKHKKGDIMKPAVEPIVKPEIEPTVKPE